MTLSFLNPVLGLKGKKRLVEIEFPDMTLTKVHVEDKYAIVDIKVKDHLGNVYQIEIQNRFRKHQDKRAFHNWTKVAALSLNDKEYYDKLKTAMSIWIMSGALPAPQNDPGRVSRICDALPRSGQEQQGIHA